MKCIFKDTGYVPKQHPCITGCQPLEQIYAHAGLGRRDAAEAARNVLRANAIINIDDILRDKELTKYQNFQLRARRALLSLPLEDKLVSYLNTLNNSIRELEDRNASSEEYLNLIGSAGKEIFTYNISKGTADKKYIRNTGKLIAQGTSLQDMLSDLEIDIQKDSYNPLNNEKVHEGLGNIIYNFHKVAKEVLSKSKSKQSIKERTAMKIAALTAGTNCCGDSEDCDSICGGNTAEEHFLLNVVIPLTIISITAGVICSTIIIPYCKDRVSK